MTRTRFAPSPTGFLHIGNLRTAVYAYAMARHDGGQFILRIEDTDQKRQVEDGIGAIKNTLEKFSITWDEYYVQSQRKESGIYQNAAKKLVDEGHAFYCQCPPRDAKHEGFSPELRDPCRDKGLNSGAIKLRVPDNEKVTYFDFVLDKEISWDTNTVYDATLLKTDGFPTYHLAAMTDDIDMKISHIMRGHDWMPSTPIHLLVFKYLGQGTPQIGHLTDIQSPNGGKLSKRRDAVFCESFLDDGYLPEALLNFIILLGWAPKDNRELFTLDEFVQSFDPAGFQKSNPLFTYNKLDWFNGQYIRQKTDQELALLVRPHLKHEVTDDRLLQILPMVKERLTKLSDIGALTEFFFTAPNYDAGLWQDPQASRAHLEAALDALDNQEIWDKASLDAGLLDRVDRAQWKRGDFFMSLRIAVCGTKFTPPLTDTMEILGRQHTVSRVKTAINLLTSFTNST